MKAQNGWENRIQIWNNLFHLNGLHANHFTGTFHLKYYKHKSTLTNKNKMYENEALKFLVFYLKKKKKQQKLLLYPDIKYTFNSENIAHFGYSAQSFSFSIITMQHSNHLHMSTSEIQQAWTRVTLM